jgi:large subunit ribosomal protein L24
MSAAKIKKGDNVVVRSGKDKGRTGTVLCRPKEGKLWLPA